MTISELIELLEELKAEHGDLPCYDFDHVEVMRLPVGHGDPGLFVSFYEGQSFPDGL